MDDKDGEERIRLRTRSGAQILLDETNGLVYIINRDGTAWMQMDAEGNIDAYSKKSYSIRSEGNINLRADNAVNIEGKKINIRSEQDIKMLAEKDFNISTKRNFTIGSEKDIAIRSKGVTAMDQSIFARGTGASNPPKLVFKNGTIVTRKPTHEPSPTHKLAGLSNSILDVLDETFGETFKAVIENLGIDDVLDLISEVTSGLSQEGGILENITDLATATDSVKTEVKKAVFDKLPKGSEAVKKLLKGI
jgi:hypothetical protein